MREALEPEPVVAAEIIGAEEAADASDEVAAEVQLPQGQEIDDEPGLIPVALDAEPQAPAADTEPAEPAQPETAKPAAEMLEVTPVEEDLEVLKPGSDPDILERFMSGLAIFAKFAVSFTHLQETPEQCCHPSKLH